MKILEASTNSDWAWSTRPGGCWPPQRSWERAAAWELRGSHPFLDLRMLGRHGALLLTYADYKLTFLIIYGMLYAFLRWLEQAHGQQAYGLSPEPAWLLLPTRWPPGRCTARVALATVLFLDRSIPHRPPGPAGGHG